MRFYHIQPQQRYFCGIDLPREEARQGQGALDLVGQTGSCGLLHATAQRTFRPGTLLRPALDEKVGRCR